LVFTNKVFHDNVKTKVLLSRCEAEKMQMHFWDKTAFVVLSWGERFKCEVKLQQENL
jgi:hypothetical protein